MTPEEEKIYAGVLYKPGAPELRQIKLRSHNLCTRYNRTFEDETEYRAQLLDQILGYKGKNVFMQGPIFFHYGTHTRIGDNFFGNYNLTVQDDGPVTIGDNVNFGPNVTIVTPMHPLLPDERNAMLDEEGNPSRFCYALPVVIGNNIWFGANVTVCGGVTIGDNCVIGAGSVVTRDIPANSLAAGVPCRVIRELNERDSMIYKPEILGNNRVMPKEQ